MLSANTQPRSKMNYYKQCILQKGATFQVAWIPSDKAKLNKVLNLKKESDGWLVTEIWGTLDQETVESNANDYRYHRIATDI